MGLLLCCQASAGGRPEARPDANHALAVAEASHNEAVAPPAADATGADCGSWRGVWPDSMQAQVRGDTGHD
jgi:hypothetical protein